ncbi:AMP deaminase isoform X2 [Andrena cerasifolii]|uniref:AMP deaminase isoform X2 n=1 Tax=Andrena cerasifolii TaxID=2819439 RepID=UPI0040384C83
MTSFYEGQDYYKRMLELQEKLRRRHDACINRLRIRYIEFLEEQRTRDERNHKLLDALDRVDNSLALMTAKTNKLNVLRKQYDTYLRRGYAPRCPTGRINDATNQAEDKYTRRNATAAQIYLPPEVKTISSAPMFLSNHQASHSPSAPRLTKSIQNMYYDNRQQDIPQPRALNQQPNDSQSAAQMHSPVQRNSIERSPSLMLSSPIYQEKKHPYYSRNHQLDPQINSPRQQSVVHFNEPSTQRMGAIQTASRFTAPEPTNGNTPSYKSLDVFQNRATPYYSNPPTIMEPSRQQTPEGLLGNLQPRLRKANELSPTFGAAAVITGRHAPGAPETPLHLPKQLLPSHLNYSPRNTDYCRRPSTNDHLYSTFDDDYMPPHGQKSSKRPSSTRAGRLSLGMKQVLDEVDQSRATTITVENELDRYMEVIRKLNRDLDAESLEEIDHEQNTSGDVLNLTLSDDDLEATAVDRSKEKLPKEVEKILALADDLASRSADLNDAGDPGNRGRDENRNVELIARSATDGGPATVPSAREGRVTPMPYAKDEISSDVALQRPELDSHIGKPWERNDVGVEETRVTQQHQRPGVLEGERIGSVVSSNKVAEENGKGTVVAKENVQRKVDCGGEAIRVAEESKVDQGAFDTVDELEEWSLGAVEKRVREIASTEDAEELSLGNESTNDQSESKGEDAERTESLNNVDTVESKAEELEATNVGRMDSNEAGGELQPRNAEVLQVEKDFVDEREAETSETSTSQCQEPVQEDENHDSGDNVLEKTGSAEEKLDEGKQHDEVKKEEYNEMNSASVAKEANEPEIATQGEEYKDENYVEEANQLENYAPGGEAEYANPTEEYYDENAAYENGQNQDYQEYATQEYVEGSNEQYEGYTSEQYDQYANVPEGQYEQDPNAQYQGDPNQEYAYSYDQQYDPNQAYETDVNQPFEYTETYDPNQAEVAEAQEGNTGEEQNEESKEPPEESKCEEMQKTSEKVEADQSGNEKLSPENEPKKKKDVIKSLLESDTDSTIERNVSNTESDFDFN